MRKKYFPLESRPKNRETVLLMKRHLEQRHLEQRRRSQTVAAAGLPTPESAIDANLTAEARETSCIILFP
eukprot:COSAG06_NODE_397_length_16244_cov_230.792320_15_plen_70_part_00